VGWGQLTCGCLSARLSGEAEIPSVAPAEAQAESWQRTLGGTAGGLQGKDGGGQAGVLIPWAPNSQYFMHI
jgi:hypothetical protein